MNDDHLKPSVDASQESAYTPTADQSGKPVEVVRKDLENEHSDTEGVDKIITPTSTREKEQDAQTLQEKNAEVERQLGSRG
jgi:hypothetical protein